MQPSDRASVCNAAHCAHSGLGATELLLATLHHVRGTAGLVVPGGPTCPIACWGGMTEGVPWFRSPAHPPLMTHDTTLRKPG